MNHQQMSINGMMPPSGQAISSPHQQYPHMMHHQLQFPPHNQPPFLNQRNIPSHNPIPNPSYQQDSYGPSPPHGRFNNGGNNPPPFDRNNGGGKYLPPPMQQMSPMNNRMPIGIRKPISKDNGMRSGHNGGYNASMYRNGERDSRSFRNYDNGNTNNHHPHHEFHGQYQGNNRMNFSRGYPHNDNFNGGRNEVGQHKLGQGAFHRTKLCPAVESGMQCKKGDKCNYAHSKEELREPPNLKKTKLCQLFEMTRCNLGDKCDFAHGVQELKGYGDKFKTMLCQNFAKSGACPNGDRCQYAHGENDIRKPNQTINSQYANQSQPQPMQQNQPPQQQKQSVTAQQQQILAIEQQQQPLVSQPQQQPQLLPQQNRKQEQTQVQYPPAGSYPVQYPQTNPPDSLVQPQPVQQNPYTQPLPQPYAAQPFHPYSTQQQISYIQPPSQSYSYV